jgi:hypothetical protein
VSATYGRARSAILLSTFVFKFMTALIFPVLAATISA